MRKTLPKRHRSNAGSRALALSTALCGGLMGAAQAEDTTPLQDEIVQATSDEGSAERIARAGELRMLSQRVVSAACFLHAGLETDSSRNLLGAAVQDFETIAAALEFGNADLGVIGTEERRRTLAGLAKLNEQWAPIAQAARNLADGTGGAPEITTIATQSVDLLDTTNRLVVQITSQYARQTTVLTSDALRLDLAGRQRTLAQQIAKNGCLIAQDISVAGADDELRMAAENFEISMNALRFGLDDVGIMPPPNQEIVDSLDEIARQWSFMSRIVSSLTAGNAVDGTTLGVLFLMSNQVTDNMEHVVTQYTEASKLGS